MKLHTTTPPTTSTEIFQIGDYIRSYDFKHIDNCYIEGVVDKVGGFPLDADAKNYLSFKCHTKVSNGKEEPSFGKRYWVPQNGSLGFGGATNRVVRLDDTDYKPLLKSKGLI